MDQEAQIPPPQAVAKAPPKSQQRARKRKEEETESEGEEPEKKLTEDRKNLQTGKVLKKHDSSSI